MHGCRTFAAAVSAGKHEVAPAQGKAAQGPFGSRVVDLDTPSLA
jgi:hypothetical protein